jgi:predicted Holliday junction resolvase-like endonuclease
VNIVTALIAAEIVCIITLILEHAFNKVDRLITSLKEEIKEKDEIIKRLLQKDINNGDVNNGDEGEEEEDEKNETKLKEL